MIEKNKKSKRVGCSADPEKKLNPFLKEFEECPEIDIDVSFVDVSGKKKHGNLDNIRQEKIKNLDSYAIDKLTGDFKGAQLGRIRRILSLYIFQLLLIPEIDLNKLILHLEEIDTSKIILNLKNIFINSNRENPLFSQFTDSEGKKLHDMAVNYPETLIKFFSDIIEIIKLLIISIKSHKIISADFSILPFVRYLMNKNINLFLKIDRLRDVVAEIFTFLKESKDPDIFPAKYGLRTQTLEDIVDRNVYITGHRIKIYVMNHIYNGIYCNNGKVSCPDCLNEELTVNIYSPRLRSKEFHHNDEKEESYSAFDLYYLFAEDRGNPFFLPNLIKKIELESVILKCGSHHSLIRAFHFRNFKKLISWENIPSEFPQDVFDLPAEIIRMLIMVCVDNFSLTKSKNVQMKKAIRRQLRLYLKKRYIIDSIYGGVCPICREFNTIDHLVSFEFNHLYGKNELNPEELEIRIDDTRSLYRSMSCTEIVIELEKQKGGYICRNCHFVIHEDMSVVNAIYNDQNIIVKVFNDYDDSIRKFKQKLIHSNKLIKDPLKSEIFVNRSHLNYLIALFEISKRKQNGVTRRDLSEYLGVKTYNNIFENRRFFSDYVEIVIGNQRFIKYSINDEGKRIVRLIYYFRDYYKQYK